MLAFVSSFIYGMNTLPVNTILLMNKFNQLHGMSGQPFSGIN